jgi:hypothetical protein
MVLHVPFMFGLLDFASEFRTLTLEATLRLA